MAQTAAEALNEKGREKGRAEGIIKSGHNPWLSESCEMLKIPI